VLSLSHSGSAPHSVSVVYAAKFRGAPADRHREPAAMNFFRALMSSFMVAAFSAVLLMALVRASRSANIGDRRCDSPPPTCHRVPLRVRAPPRCWPVPRCCILLMAERPLPPLDACGDGGVRVTSPPAFSTLPWGCFASFYVGRPDAAPKRVCVFRLSE